MAPATGLRSAGSQCERERQDGGGTSLAKQLRRDGHSPASLDPVIDEQHRAVEACDCAAHGFGDLKLVPEGAEPLRAVVLADTGPTAVCVGERAEIRHPADLRDPLAEAL